MSVASLLLRMVLMISLLLNGLNVAVASDSLLRMADATDAAAGPPCHAHASLEAAPAEQQVHAPADDGHCKIKECVRACAQQPALAGDGWMLPTVYAQSGPLASATTRHPTPASPRIQRPPIA